MSLMMLAQFGETMSEMADLISYAQEKKMRPDDAMQALLAEREALQSQQHAQQIPSSLTPRTTSVVYMCQTSATPTPVVLIAALRP